MPGARGTRAHARSATRCVPADRAGAGSRRPSNHHIPARMGTHQVVPNGVQLETAAADANITTRQVKAINVQIALVPFERETCDAATPQGNNSHGGEVGEESFLNQETNSSATSSVVGPETDVARP